MTGTQLLCKLSAAEEIFGAMGFSFTRSLGYSFTKKQFYTREVIVLGLTCYRYAYQDTADTITSKLLTDIVVRKYKNNFRAFVNFRFANIHENMQQLMNNTFCIIAYL